MNLENWVSFKGYGIIPGIQSAHFINKNEKILGSVIQVKNLDGSTHKEEIIGYQKDKYLQIKMHDFSFPLSRFSESFFEEWDFENKGKYFFVTRKFTLNEKGFFSGIFLKLIGIFLKKEVERHILPLKMGSNYR